MLKLFYRLKKMRHDLRVLDLLRKYMPTTEDGEIALSAHTLLRSLGNEQVREMVHVRAFIEMKLKIPVEKTYPFFPCLCPVFLFKEPVLAVQYRIVRQDLYGLASSAVHVFVVGGSKGEHFRKEHLKPDSHIGIL